MSLKEKILAAQDIKKEVQEIPAWGVTVEIRGFTGQQRGAFLQDVLDKNGKMDFVKMYPLLVVLSTFDPETGEPIFKMGDIDAVAGKSGAVLEQIAQVAQKLSGLDPASVGEKEKN